MKVIVDEFKKLGSGLYDRVSCSAGMRVGSRFVQNYYEHPIWIKCVAISGIPTWLESIEIILGNHSGAVFGIEAIKTWSGKIMLPEKLNLIELDASHSVLRSVPDNGIFFNLEVRPLSFILNQRLVDDDYPFLFRLTRNMFENLFEITLGSSGLDPEYFRD